MDSQTVESTAVRTLSTLFKRGKLTRTQTGLVALATLALLYAVLWTVVDQPTPVASAQEVPQVATPSATSPTDDSSLSSTFLSEYDRLAGASSTSATNADAETASAPASTLNTIFFSLLFVAGMAYVGVWGYKQYVIRQKGLPTALGGKRLSVQETQALGPNQRLHLVRLGDEVLLIGATEHTITCLARYGTEQADETFADHLATATKQTPVPTPSVPQPLSLQESLDSLRKVQHRQGGGDHA